MSDAMQVDLERKEALRAALVAAAEACAAVVKANGTCCLNLRTNKLILTHAFTAQQVFMLLQQLVSVDIQYHEARLAFVERNSKGVSDEQLNRFTKEYSEHHRRQLQEAATVTAQLERLADAIKHADN